MIRRFAPDPRPWDTNKVLYIWLVEDEPQSMELLVYMVTNIMKKLQIAYKMLQFINAEDAIAALDRTTEGSIRSILFLDQKLPGLKGSDILRYVLARDDAADMPVIMCTANPMVDGTNTFTDYGASALAPKGYTMRRLESAVRTILNGRQPTGFTQPPIAMHMPSIDDSNPDPVPDPDITG